MVVIFIPYPSSVFGRPRTGTLISLAALLLKDGNDLGQKANHSIDLNQSPITMSEEKRKDHNKKKNYPVLEDQTRKNSRIVYSQRAENRTRVLLLIRTQLSSLRQGGRGKVKHDDDLRKLTKFERCCQCITSEA
ncbi:jg14692 [Pararge aegeria aegeria]|uniref:Jg14692 protein n=1 Tax=Pararge aegeria aegeria TaxID=348720 RepID=A0A8S4SEW8_9NEOP|nr:jg14692 [Pararge aegeria aegeria]